VHRLKSATHLLEDVTHLHGDFSTPEPVTCSCRITFWPRYKHIMRDGCFEDTIPAVGFPVFRDRREAGRALA
jgi:hypothetical protein